MEGERLMSSICKITKWTNKLLIIHKLRLITSFYLFNINVSWEYLLFKVNSWDSRSYPQGVGAHRTRKGKRREGKEGKRRGKGSWDWNNWGEQPGPVIIYSQFLEDPREIPSQAKDFTLPKQKGATCKRKAMESFIPHLGMNSCTCILFPPRSSGVFVLHILKPLTFQLKGTGCFFIPRVSLPMGELLFWDFVSLNI